MPTPLTPVLSNIFSLNRIIYIRKLGRASDWNDEEAARLAFNEVPCSIFKAQSIDDIYKIAAALNKDFIFD